MEISGLILAALLSAVMPLATPGKAEETITLDNTWIDADAPYYGTHQGKKNLKWKDEPDFRPLPLANAH